ncbi:MAG: Hsp20/alpha crystallin family protein [Desulfuromonas sp.]|nr:Hsp20/alpha crystallin family protein [Desulfuromonas sp.]
MSRSIEKEPLTPFQQQQQKMAQILDNIQQGPRQTLDEQPVWQPSADVVVEGDTLLILMDLPGVDQEQICLRLDDSVLIVEGQRESLADGISCQRLECPRGHFSRRFLLPSTVSQQQLSARCERGVLQIRISGLCADDQVSLITG